LFRDGLKMANEEAGATDHKTQSPFAFNKPTRIACGIVEWRLSLEQIQIDRFDGANWSFTRVCPNGTVAATEDCDDQSVRFQFPALSAITALTALFFSRSHPCTHHLHTRHDDRQVGAEIDPGDD
jgi:hypothetical protein